MSLQEKSLASFNLRLYFVVLEKCKSEEDCSEYMWDAYNLCTENEFHPQWIQEKECYTMKPDKTDVFVMQEFQGELFEKLQNFKCLIVGPRCLLSCFMSGEPIPEGNTPVFNTAMRGVVATATGFSASIKNDIKTKVEYMGGLFLKPFRSTVTHLISNTVMSVKYERAAERKIPIFIDTWVNAIWEANLGTGFVKANDPMFERYKCPVFQNLVLTATNLRKRQKEEIKSLIMNHGGTFMGGLDGSVVKVVLAPENSLLSEKLKYARQNNIACLKVDWIYQSISAGYALPFSSYLIESAQQCSTPEKSQANPLLNFSSISVIPNVNRLSANGVDETLMTTVGGFSPSDRQSLLPHVDRIERLDIREAKLAGPFLDGCNIYLAGFATNHRDKINRILNAGGATRLDDISDALSHVIVGDSHVASADVKLMQDRGLNPYILSLDWLEASIKLKRPAPEEKYILDKTQNSNARSAEPPSPLSKKNLQMLQRPKKPPVPKFDIDTKLLTDTSIDNEEQASIVQQYLQKSIIETDAGVPGTSFQELVQPNNTTTLVEGNLNKTRSDTSSKFSKSEQPVNKTSVEEVNDSAVPFSQSMNDRMFAGMTFIVTGFDAEDSPSISISALGGKIVSNSFNGIPDYGVVPFIGVPLKHTVDEIVTDFFIDDCVEQEKIVSLAYYHRPLSISLESKPLAGCVIATSTYAGIERAYLIKLSKALGAVYQDTFARKTKENSHVASTHLLCPSPEGSKYNAAVRWKLPAVTADWLKLCAAKMRRVDEMPYLVGETMAPEKPEPVAETSQMGPPVVPSTRSTITPRRQLQNVLDQATPGFETPVINKRLNHVLSSSSQSPFHVATPDSPYGQLFKPDPSPETRKEWAKWIDGLPDFRVEEPPPKKRATVTPLSEIKRQWWSAVKKQIVGKPGDDITNNDTSTEEIEPTKDPPETPINRKLSFEEKTPTSKKQIDLQIEQLDQVLQATSSTTDRRYSLSGTPKTYPKSIETIDKCMVKDSQPDDAVGWDDPAHHGRLSHKSTVANMDPMEEESPEKPEEEIQTKRKFMMSGIKDRISYETEIKNLGGEVSSETHFDSTATHLLCIRPARNEKMLASIAAGKWVLHCSYLRDSVEKKYFLDEEMYEFGNPLSNEISPAPTAETEKALAAAAHRWRLKIQETPGGAFRDMVAMLNVQQEKYDLFERLINAGGGVVVRAKPPYDASPSGGKVTHCFIEPRKLNQPIDWAMLASKGILCFQPQYLSDYLTNSEQMDPRECVIPEFKKYLALLPK